MHYINLKFPRLMIQKLLKQIAIVMHKCYQKLLKIAFLYSALKVTTVYTRV